MSDSDWTIEIAVLESLLGPATVQGRLESTRYRIGWGPSQRYYAKIIICIYEKPDKWSPSPERRWWFTDEKKETSYPNCFYTWPDLLRNLISPTFRKRNNLPPVDPEVLENLRGIL